MWCWLKSKYLVLLNCCLNVFCCFSLCKKYKEKKIIKKNKMNKNKTKTQTTTKQNKNTNNNKTKQTIKNKTKTQTTTKQNKPQKMKQ
jgi:hypothetical protein